MTLPDTSCIDFNGQMPQRAFRWPTYEKYGVLSLVASLAMTLTPCHGAEVAAVDASKGPFAAQGSVLSPQTKDQYQRLIESTKSREVLFKDYPRKDNWDVEILPAHLPEKLVVTPDEQDAKRGFIAYSRPITSYVFPYSKPQERATAFSVQAAQGEYEPFTVCLYNLQNAGEYKISLSPFRDEASGQEAGISAEIRATTQLPLLRLQQQLHIGIPVILERRDTQVIGKDESGQFWVTTFVPHGTKPGKYTASLSVKNGSGGVTEFPVRITVLPFTLDEPKADLSMCFLIQNYPEMHPENLDLYMADMKSHGMNTAWMWPLGEMSFPENGKVQVDFAKAFSAKFLGMNYFAHSVDETLQAYKKAGFDREWIYGSYDGLISLLAEKGLASAEDPASALPHLKDYTEQLLKFTKEKNLPPFELLLIDEPGFHPERLPSVKKLYEGMQRAFPDQQLMLDCGPWAGEDKLLAPYLKDIYYTEPSAERKEFCEANGIDMGNYNAGSGGRNPLVDRFCYGFWPMKAGLKGVSNWVYTWRFETKVPDGNTYVFPEKDGPVPTTCWEAVREGIDDQRYLLTFRRLAEEAAKSGDPKRMELAAKLRRGEEEFMSQVPINRSHRREFVEGVSPLWFDGFRSFLIHGILQLDQGKTPRAGEKKLQPNLEQSSIDVGNGVNEGLEKPAKGMPATTKGFLYNLDMRYSSVPSEGGYFGGVRHDWFALVTPEGHVEFGFLTGDVKLLRSSVRLKPEQWYNIALSVSGEQATILVDGTLVAAESIEPREWNWDKPIRLSGFPWEAPDAKGYYGHHGFLVGQLREIALTEA
jgi:hypothetical protein